MPRPEVLGERPIYHNGVYPHTSFRKPHRIQVMEIGGGVAVVLLIAAMAAIAVAALLGAFWMIRTLFELLGRHA